MRTGRLTGLGVVAALLVSCGGERRRDDVAVVPQQAVEIQVTSSAFQQDGAIPAKHSRQGGNVSPPLAWRGIPEGTKEIVLVCDDPDAPSREPWVHWLLYAVPGDSTQLKEGIPKEEKLPDGSMQGKNSWGAIGYDGPQPPSGTHHYHFKLYALDQPSGLQPGATRAKLLNAIKGHVIAQGELVGTFAAR